MPTPGFEPRTSGLGASALATRPSCLGDMLRRQVQNNVRGDDLVHLNAFRLYSFLPLRVECDPMFHGWFGPTYMELALVKQSLEPAPSNAPLIFGVITCIAGIVGVIIGSFASTYLRRFNAKADPLICAYGVLASVPLIFSGVVVSEYSVISSWVLIFLGEVCLCVNWTIVADMLLYVIVPTRRSIAEAVQILVAHALGDACSPYIIGQVSDSIYHSSNASIHKYLSLQYALYIPTGVLVIGAFFFFLTALHIEKDKAKCSFATHGLYPPLHIFAEDPIQIPADEISDSRHLL
ncbi:Protein spinster 1 [Araneus ventricosus]|uniref:Protein spinster 1 n=1 Tax=Araneus ventricosus TaxID=182803 RepID=A0A4Y2DSP5_ARAVE|nr:Protein spinster 1 [Araneus ventricosus]